MNVAAEGIIMGMGPLTHANLNGSGVVFASKMYLWLLPVLLSIPKLSFIHECCCCPTTKAA